MKSFLLALVVLLLPLAPPGGAQDKASPLPPPWNQWRYSRSLELDPNQTGALARVTVPVEVFAGAQPRLADLRLIDDAAQEVP